MVRGCECGADGSRYSGSFLASTPPSWFAVEGALVGDLRLFGDLVADGLAVRGTKSSAINVVLRLAVVVAFGGG